MRGVPVAVRAAGGRRVKKKKTTTDGGKKAEPSSLFYCIAPLLFSPPAAPGRAVGTGPAQGWRSGRRLLGVLNKYPSPLFFFPRTGGNLTSFYFFCLHIYILRCVVCGAHGGGKQDAHTPLNPPPPSPPTLSLPGAGPRPRVRGVDGRAEGVRGGRLEGGEKWKRRRRASTAARF